MREPSANPYTDRARALVERWAEGRVLDCGAGLRRERFPHVVCCDVTPLDGLHLVGRGEALPFPDATFDGVLSLSVLEHVPRPELHAAELLRVLKPGGELLVDAAFLQPRHGFPSHWQAFTRAGLERLFLDLENVDCRVGPHQQPWVGLRWILGRFVAGIADPAVRRAFLARPVGDLLEAWRPLDPPDGALLLDDEATEDLAAGFSLLGRKARPGETPRLGDERGERLAELLVENAELRRRVERLERRKGPGGWVRSLLGRFR